MIDPRWGFRRGTTKPYPVQGSAATATPGPVVLDLKDYFPKETLAQLRIRVFGNIVVTDPGGGVAGTPTGKDNPEAMLVSANLVTSPSYGVQTVQNLFPRALNRMNAFDRGYQIAAPSIPNAAGTYAVNVEYLINFKRGGSIIPIEYSLPMSVFDTAQLTLNFGGAEQFFTGGTFQWNFQNLQVEIRAYFDVGVAGKFHITEFLEKDVQILGTQTDLEIPTLAAGYYYTDLLIMTERDNVLVNDILNNATIQSAGRIWEPQGDSNAFSVQQLSRDQRISDPAFNMTGLYMFSFLQDGMYSNAVECMDAKLTVLLDVTSGSGSQFARCIFRRMIPQGIDATGTQALTASGSST